jgi:ABC-type branched-subunit amino acid transport system substrate-binding protein
MGAEHTPRPVPLPQFGRSGGLWARHSNAAGGVNERKIRVVVKDDAYDPGQAVANVNEMKDSVFALVCLLGTAVLNANKDTVAETGIPTFRLL